MPQTFSPQTSVMPDMHAPAAKCSQLRRAISVEPSAPVMIGRRSRILVDAPYSASVLADGKECVVGRAYFVAGQSLGAESVPLDVKVGVVDGVILVRPGRKRAEGTRVDYLASAKRGLEDLAIAFASIDAARAEP